MQFQFHKGTIRTLCPFLASLPLRHFNSIKVQLERLFLLILSTEKLIFQFHKGTIRTLKIVIKVLIYALFQFHKGTIRTAAPIVGPVVSAAFQFHKGTIRTPYLSPTPFFPFFISIP